MQLIYRLLEKGFIDYLIRKQGKRIELNSLKYEFTDLGGHQYYSFPKEVSLPIARLAKLQEYVMWLQRGIDNEEYYKMLDAADVVLTEGLTNKKGGSKVGFIISELKYRKDMIINEELFYNFIAVQLVRSDEAVLEFNNEIHLKKVDAIRKLNTSNDTFFLIIQKYLRVLNLSDITREELMKLLEESLTRTEATRSILLNLLEK